MRYQVLLLLYFLFLHVKAYESYLSLARPLEKSSKQPQKSLANSERCASELVLFQQALVNQESWAVRFMDTWAKVNAGYLSGNTIIIGDFDSCVQFQHQYESGRTLQGQHCLVALSALPNSTLTDDRSDLSLKHAANFFRNNGIVVTNGFCVPNTCKIEEVVPFLNMNYLLRNDLVAVGGVCRDIHETEIGALQYFAISFFSIFAIIITLSTIYDIIKSKSTNSKPNKLLASFSVYTNGWKLFDITKNKSPSSINCLHGLRGMSIFWIILGHRIYNQYPFGNPKDAQNFLNSNLLIGSIIRAHPIAVDTFFVMGAILMTWTTLRDCENKQLNIARMIWRRYLRYTPVFAAIILLVVAFAELFLQGPFYFEKLIEPCVKNWWYALLHIQNYIPSDEMCLNHTWYLSADFQLFIISPFIVWLIHKYGKFLLAIPAVLFLATMAYIISISIIYDIEMPSPTASKEYLKFIYYVTHSRAGPWFLGMISGYVLYIYRGRTFKINKFLNAFLWIYSFSTIIALTLLQTVIATASDPLPRAVHVSFLSLHRILWAIEICWITFACQNLKTGGILRWFLSLPQWQPISRMGLSMYILGAVYQIIMILNQRVPLYINFWSVIPILMSDIIIIAMISIIFYLAFEAPPLIIEDYIYKKFKHKTS